MGDGRGTRGSNHYASATALKKSKEIYDCNTPLYKQFQVCYKAASNLNWDNITPYFDPLKAPIKVVETNLHLIWHLNGGLMVASWVYFKCLETQ